MACNSAAQIKTVPMRDLAVWELAKKDRTLLSVTLELTARCNNNCSHCYINLPAGDINAQKKECSFEQIKTIIDEAVSLGVLWVLLSGGEPLLRPDFFDIYLYIKKKGILVSVFTNASLITEQHVKLFKKYPPRDLEITVYGVTERVHTKVTRKNTFSSTFAGIDMLLANHIPVTLKTTIMKSNVNELASIAEFCRSKSKLSFRFDPALHLRIDGNPQRNNEIISERLLPDEILSIEKKDPARSKALKKTCQDRNTAQTLNKHPKKLLRCQAGINSCCIDYTGMFKLCCSLSSEQCVYDLKTGSLTRAWYEFAPQILQMESDSTLFAEKCGECTMHDLCSWCPAHAVLETGRLDGEIPYFCNIAHSKNETFC